MFFDKWRAVCLCILISLSSWATAGNEEGLAAYNKKDYETALREWQKAADEGNIDAQSNMGLLYEKGLGVPQSDEQAIVWYTKAANQGSETAQFNLGIKYYNALGVPQDYKKSFFWFSKSANQGNAIAQFNLGVMYANSQGVGQDYVQAAKWYTAASKQCYTQAQINLWDLYESGKVQKPASPLVKWFYAPTEKPVCVRVANPKANPDEFKITPAQFPNGIFVSVIRRPLWRDQVRYPKIEVILTSQLKGLGFKIADSMDSASAVISFNTSNELDIAEIEKGETDKLSRGLSILDKVAGAALGHKYIGADYTVANGLNLNLNKKTIGISADLDLKNQDAATKNSFVYMNALFSEDGYEVSTKLLILAFDEWAKTHVENQNRTQDKVTPAVSEKM